MRGVRLWPRDGRSTDEVEGDQRAIPMVAIILGLAIGQAEISWLLRGSAGEDKFTG